ncbi:MAG: hypothetical protein GY851_26660, partial [bacterium]|nr:hypothetical protein [bacterium]
MVEMKGGSFSGRVLDNVANAARSGSGFNPLFHAAFPGRNLFRDDHVGLNFEHIFNGATADRDIAMFTPRRDACTISQPSPTSVSLHWPAAESAWGIECTLTYSLAAESAIDIKFECTSTKDKFPLGYVAMMWASYMNHTKGREIHFYGKNGDTEGWTTFGEKTEDGFET